MWSCRNTVAFTSFFGLVFMVVTWTRNRNSMNIKRNPQYNRVPQTVVRNSYTHHSASESALKRLSDVIKSPLFQSVIQDSKKTRNVIDKQPLKRLKSSDDVTDVIKKFSDQGNLQYGPHASLYVRRTPQYSEVIKGTVM